MTRLIVATSKVEDGNMHIAADKTNATVLSNRRKWLGPYGIDINGTTRVSVTYDREDFCQYRTVQNTEKGDGMQDAGIEPSDALVVTEPGHALFLPIADCVATALYDEDHSILMLSHLGRHSLEQDGGYRSVQFLIERYSTNPASLKVWLSPTPNKDAYPIYALDDKGMKEVVYEQLAKAGVLAENITDNTADTTTDPEYYSHSAFLKGAKTEDGRFAMVAMMMRE
jgi:copper oxidase (laccase) domain-containing protein